MPNAWICDGCGEVFLSAKPQTKIIVSIKPRDYVSERTFCSLRCFDDTRETLLDEMAWALERNGDA